MVSVFGQVVGPTVVSVVVVSCVLPVVGSAVALGQVAGSGRRRIRLIAVVRSVAQGQVRGRRSQR
jgi:hypothetical protein